MKTNIKLLHQIEIAIVKGANECLCRWPSKHNLVRHVKISDITNSQSHDCRKICCHQHKAEFYQFYIDINFDTYLDKSTSEPTSCYFKNGQ